MSEPSFLDGEVVWVKWSNCWWPGEFWESSRVPQEVHASLRKPPIAFVKFFQEDSYEFVRNANNILKYNCDKKLEFIRKGIEKHKANIKVMANFPDDVVKAEQLTNGNINILNTIATPSKQKPNTNVTPISTPETSKKSLVSKPTNLEQQIIAKQHSSIFKVQSSQKTASPANDNFFKCTVCNFQTDRMKVLIFHLNHHSTTLGTVPRTTAPPIKMKKDFVTLSSEQKVENDSIADDVRKIKESMKGSASTVKKTSAKGNSKSLPNAIETIDKSKGRVSRSSKASDLVAQELPVSPPKKQKPNLELKKELLADWIEYDDTTETDKKEDLPVIEKIPAPVEIKVPSPDKTAESSRSIRNIPKKQREVYIQPDVIKPVDIMKSPETPKSQETCEVSTSSVKTISDDLSNELKDESTSEIEPKKAQKSTRRKRGASDIVNEIDSKKSPEDNDQLLIMATEDLLNETEVPKMDEDQLPSTFHKSNDIDKRNLPPKERNKRIFRAKNSRESTISPMKPTIELITEKNLDNNGTNLDLAANKSPSIAPLSSQNELMLPHKKKHSSRLLASASKQDSQLTETRTRKKRKSSEIAPADNANSLEKIGDEKDETELSPLRDSADTNRSPVHNSTSSQSHRRGVKRRNSKDSQQLEKSMDIEVRPELKKAHKAEQESQGRTIVACSSEAICITSKGNLSVARRESIVTTQANTVKVTSQVIISEATHTMTSSIIIPEQCSEIITTSKPKPSPLKTITLKHALKISPENLEEMKRQGLVAVENNKTRLTPKGMQQFKEKKQNEQKTAETESTLLKDSEQIETQTPIAVEESNNPESNDGNEIDSKAIESVEETLDESIEPVKTVPEQADTAPESNGANSLVVTDNDSTNNNDIEKETDIASVGVESELLSKDVLEESPTDPIENGKESEEPESSTGDDANESSGGLIAIAAESFGGPPNCFYLCRQVEGRYEPVDNQILVLNAQNALVPFEGEILAGGEILAEGMMSSSSEDATTDNLTTGYPQMSPNSNIIINTPAGRKVELNHYTILALQQQADEHGNATIEMDGEQLQLNLNAILDVLGSQNDDVGASESLISGAMLIDNEEAMIIDASDIATTPIEMHHSATQVSETLSKPIMSTTIAPEIPVKSTVCETVTRNLNIEDSLAKIGLVSHSRANVPKSLELPITVTDPTIAETVNHRKLANAPILGDISDIITEGIVIQSTDNGSSED